MRPDTWITLMLGIWLIASPNVLGHASRGAAKANDIILGILLFVSSGWILRDTTQLIAVSCFEILCGAWLCRAPYLLHYERLSLTTANDVVVGIITLLVGFIEAWTLKFVPTHS